MKRILFVGTGEDFPSGAFAFLRSLRDFETVQVTGLFFSPLDFDAIAMASQVPIAGPYLQVKEKEKKIVAENKARFASLCEEHNIKYDLHDNDQDWGKDVLAHETRFADLVLLSGELFYAELSAGQPNSFLQQALHISECPVVIVPENYTPPDKIVIAYDGSRKSLYAIKQFCYLMPQLTDLPTEIVYVHEESSQAIPGLENLKKFSRAHFGCMNFAKLNFKASDYFADWLSEKHHPLLVSGSFGRNTLSYITKRSFSEKVISEHKMPVFIAHP